MFTGSRNKGFVDSLGSPCYLSLVNISIDHFPPLSYSLDTIGYLLLIKQELNKVIREDTYN
jgi:hypothetical protein